MAVDNRPFKSKEQDGQGNEVIIRDQQLVEQGTATTMASGAYFETRDVDDRPVKIPRDNMMNIVLECIGIILNDSSRNLGTNVQKALGLQGNTVGHSTVSDFASVLGDIFRFRQIKVITSTVRGWFQLPISSSVGSMFVNVRMTAQNSGNNALILVQQGHATFIGTSGTGSITAAYSESHSSDVGNFIFYVENGMWKMCINMSSMDLEWVIDMHY